MGSSLTVHADDGNYMLGEVVEFGSYPQTQVTDETLINELNSVDVIAKNFEEYYHGEINSKNHGAGDPIVWVVEDSSMMEYKDVVFNGEKYRGVKIWRYRPRRTDYFSDEDYSCQDENGYEKGTYYWFKYEPLKWRVFDSEKGLALCESVIDSQPFNNSYKTQSDGSFLYSTTPSYANSYGPSYLNQWLNSAFLDTAFTAEEQALLPETLVDTSDNNGEQSKYRSAAVEAKVVLLTYKQAFDFEDEEGYLKVKDEFSNTAEDKLFTDYSRIQGSSNEGWWLATPCGLDNLGSANINYVCPVVPSRYWKAPSSIFDISAAVTSIGVRPVIELSGILETEDEKDDSRFFNVDKSDNEGSDNQEDNGIKGSSILITAVICLSVVLIGGIFLIQKKKK